MSRLSLSLVAFSILFATAACAQPASGSDPSAGATLAGEQAATVTSDAAGPLAVVDITGGLEHPWGMAFLPDGRLLVTERPGRLRIVSADGSLSDPVEGVPEVYARRQGGLLDVALAPDFAESGYVYLSFARSGPDGSSATALGRGLWRGDAIEDFETLFTQDPWFTNGLHFGGRIAFDPAGEHVFLGLGERFQFDPAQDLSDHMGTVIRLRLDGSIPDDNPFVGQEGAQPAIWSYGHRNVQSLAFHPETGDLWEAEFGPLGGDELNRITPGTNYGWPVVSWGINYDGTGIPDPPTRPEFADVVVHWTPAVSPSGMTFYTGDIVPEWTGSLLISSLSKQGLVRVTTDGTTAQEAETLSLGARIRDVEQGPDGHIYVLVDARDGNVWRLSPLAAAVTG